MKFNLDNTGKYVFSEERTMTPSDLEELGMQCRAQGFEYIKSTVGTIKEGGYKEFDATKKCSLALMAVCVIAIILGMFLKNVVLCLGGFSVVFFIGGLFSFIKGASVYNADPLLNRAMGLLIMVLPALPLTTWFLIMKDDATVNKVFVIIGEVLGIIGLLLAVRVFCALTSGKRVYTEKVNATCIGYARYVEYDNDEPGRVGRHVQSTGSMHPFVSPVFEYNYEGEDYISVYDDFRRGADSDVLMGPTVINISPKNPEGVYNSKPADVGIQIVCAIMMLVFSGIMILMVTSGYTSNFKKTGDGSYVITSTSETSSKKILRDEMIKYDGDWYIEKVTITSIERLSNGDIYTFYEDGFSLSKDNETGIYNEGQELYALYYIDEKALDDGQYYKVVITLVDPEEYDYQGSHGAWE